MKQLKFLSILLGLSVLTHSLNSCKIKTGIFTNSNTDYSYTNVMVNNPQVLVPISTSATTYVGFEMEVDVKVLTSAGTLVPYSNGTYIIDYASGPSVPSSFTQTLIKIPKSGAYAVTCSLRSLGCSKNNQVVCSSGSSKLYYTGTQTFSSPVSLVNFLFTSGNINYQMCC